MIGADRALDVLRHLAVELGEPPAPGTRAIVGLRAQDDDTVALVDVTLRDNGVLELPDDGVDGLVVVTDEEISSEEGTDPRVVALHQLVSVLPDGTEAGLYLVADDPTVREWRTDLSPSDSQDPEAVEALRPRDVASNTARRALGLPSLVDELPPVTDLLARAWLLDVAREAVTRFDQPDGPRDVSPDELAEVANAAGDQLLDGLASDLEPTWEDLHRLAAGGRLSLGSFEMAPAHATWLDTPGFAQVLDRTLPSVGELLGSLQVVGEDDLLAWAIEWLSVRNWYDGS